MAPNGKSQVRGSQRAHPPNTRCARRATPASQSSIRLCKYVKRMDCGSRTYKPNSVRLAAGRSFLWATHYCEAQATYPEVVARRAGTRPQRSRSLARNSLPIWSCSVWGLPCPAHYCGGGALLPHLFTLTRALRPGRYVFCGTFRRTIPPIEARGPSRTLSGTLLCGVRTFLCLATATVRSGCQQGHYSAGRRRRQRVRPDAGHRMAYSLTR